MAQINFPNPTANNPNTGLTYGDGWYNSNNGVTYAYIQGSWRTVEVSSPLNDLYVLEDGDTMTGPLILHADPTNDLQAATKQYVDTEITTSEGRETQRLDDRYLIKNDGSALDQTVQSTGLTKFNGLVEASTGVTVTGKSNSANITRESNALGLRIKPSAISRSGGQVIGTNIATPDSITIDSNQPYYNLLSDTSTNSSCGRAVCYQANMASTNATNGIGFNAQITSEAAGTNFYGYYSNISDINASISGNIYAIYAEGVAPSRFNGRIISTAGVIGNVAAEEFTERPGAALGKFGFELQTSNVGSVCSFARDGGGGPVLEVKQTGNSGNHIQFNTEKDGILRLDIGHIQNNANKDGLVFHAGGAASLEAAYTFTSDRRVKSNIVDAPSAVDLIKALQPRQYDLAISKNVRGFIADELQQVVPEAVVGTANAEQAIGTLADYDGTVLETEVTEPDVSELTYTEDVETDGVTTQTVRTRTWTATGTRPVYQAVDLTKLVPLLTKALQEALTEIDTLKDRLDILEGN